MSNPATRQQTPPADPPAGIPQDTRAHKSGDRNALPPRFADPLNTHARSHSPDVTQKVRNVEGVVMTVSAPRWQADLIARMGRARVGREEIQAYLTEAHGLSKRDAFYRSHAFRGIKSDSRAAPERPTASTSDAAGARPFEISAELFFTLEKLAIGAGSKSGLRKLVMLEMPLPSDGADELVSRFGMDLPELDPATESDPASNAQTALTVFHADQDVIGHYTGDDGQEYTVIALRQTADSVSRIAEAHDNFEDRVQALMSEHPRMWLLRAEQLVDSFSKFVRDDQLGRRPLEAEKAREEAWATHRLKTLTGNLNPGHDHGDDMQLMIEAAPSPTREVAVAPVVDNNARPLADFIGEKQWGRLVNFAQRTVTQESAQDPEQQLAFRKIIEARLADIDAERSGKVADHLWQEASAKFKPSSAS